MRRPVIALLALVVLVMLAACGVRQRSALTRPGQRHEQVMAASVPKRTPEPAVVAPAPAVPLQAEAVVAEPAAPPVVLESAPPPRPSVDKAPRKASRAAPVSRVAMVKALYEKRAAPAKAAAAPLRTEPDIFIASAPPEARVRSPDPPEPSVTPGVTEPIAARAAPPFPDRPTPSVSNVSRQPVPVASDASQPKSALLRRYVTVFACLASLALFLVVFWALRRSYPTSFDPKNDGVSGVPPDDPSYYCDYDEVPPDPFWDDSFPPDPDTPSVTPSVPASTSQSAAATPDPSSEPSRSSAPPFPVIDHSNAATGPPYKVRPPYLN